MEARLRVKEAGLGVFEAGLAAAGGINFLPCLGQAGPFDYHVQRTALPYVNHFMACANRMVSTGKERSFQDHLWRFPFLATQVTGGLSVIVLGAFWS